MGKIIGFQRVLDYMNSKTTISKLDVGEYGYIVPWMLRQANGGIFLQDCKVDPTSGGTLCVKVTKISDEKDGFEIDYTEAYDEVEIQSVDTENDLSSGIVGGSNIKWIRVAELKDAILEI